MALIRYIGIEGMEASAAFEAARIIADGGIVIYPTETLYGIGADCKNSDTIQKINILKGRSSDEPQIVLLDMEWLPKYIVDSKSLLPLLDAFSPGPLTIIAKAKKNAVPKILAPNGKLAFRISSSWFVRKILNIFGRGITSTSVNISSSAPLSQPDEIIDSFWDSVDGMFLFHDEILSGPPSTIIDASEFPGNCEIIREGAISEEAIERAIEIK